MNNNQFVTYQAMRCKRKKPLDTKRAAKMHGKKKGCFPYKCPVCYKWHVSSNPQRIKV